MAKYYDIDDIITDEEIVAVIFQKAASGVGIDPSSETDCVQGIKDVLTKAHTAAFTAASKNLTILTKKETNLYEAAQSSMAAFKKWQMGGPRFQKASILGRKRKSTE